MKTRHIAFIGLSLSAVVAMAANDPASGPKHRNDPPSPVEYLAHIPRLQYVSFSAAVFSPDGQTLMTSINRFDGGGGIPMQPSSGAIQLWRAKNGRFLRELTAQTRPVWALAVSPDGTSLAAAQQGPGPGAAVNLLDLASDSTRHTLVLGADTFHVSSLAFSLDGRWLATASGTHDGRGNVRLWDVSSGELKRMVTDSDLGASSVGWESQVSFSPEGTILAIAGDNQTINLWSVADDKWRGSFGPGDPPEPGRCVMQFVRDGLLLAGVNWFQQVEVKLWSYPGN